MWRFRRNVDYVALYAGASLRHVSAVGGVVFVATSSGQLFGMSARNGAILFSDQTPDLNEVFSLGLGKPHHASMNGGTTIAGDMVFAPSGAQNNPSGGLFAYEVNERPIARPDWIAVPGTESIIIDALANDTDPNGDRLQFVRVAGSIIDTEDGIPDEIQRQYGVIVVVNPGDDPDQPDAAYLEFIPSPQFRGQRQFRYTVEDLAPNRRLNGFELNEPIPNHVPRADGARVRLVAVGR